MAQKLYKKISFTSNGVLAEICYVYTSEYGSLFKSDNEIVVVHKYFGPLFGRVKQKHYDKANKWADYIINLHNKNNENNN
jgi:hypothetical protein